MDFVNHFGYFRAFCVILVPKKKHEISQPKRKNYFFTCFSLFGVATKITLMAIINTGSKQASPLHTIGRSILFLINKTSLRHIIGEWLTIL